MVLHRDEAMRFFTMFDKLSIYAHERLHVEEDAAFWSGKPPIGIGDEAQRETMNALWSNRSILDDYVRENPDGLEKRDLRILTSWKRAYSDMFYISRTPSGEVVFFAQDYAFAVCGLSKEIEEMVGALPAMATATLLPYVNHIVYDQHLGLLPLEMGQNMRDTFEKELADALAQGRLARTGTQLELVAPRLEHQRDERKMEDFRREIEREERAAGPHEGQRESALLGLSDEERDAVIMRHIHEQDDGANTYSLQNAIDKTLDSWCTPGPLRTSLVDLLTDEELPPTDVLLERIDEEANAAKEALPQENGDDLALLDYLDQEFESMRDLVRTQGPAAYLAHELVDPDSLEGMLEMQSLEYLHSLKKLVENAGSMRFVRSDIKSLRGFLHPVRGICYLFRDGDVYQYVIPDETYRALRTVDWNRVESRVADRERWLHFAEEIVELCGMVPYHQAVLSYMRAYPDSSEDVRDLHDILLDAIEDDVTSVYLLTTDETAYMLHFELMDMYLADKGRKLKDAQIIEKGELDTNLNNLRAMQEKKEPRVPTAEMLAEPSVFHWKEKQPPARALRDFLDAHVPDEADEYLFADKVMEDLLEEAKWGIDKGSVGTFFKILENNGFIPDESQVQQLLTFWQNLCNGLPIWPNNGWSPNELVSRTASRRVFYNPDGSIMRVGRNDPCPCGSGKKYKRCHGR